MSAASGTRARLVAGVEIESRVARVALVERADARRRVRALEREPLSARAVERGSVRDPDAVERAVRSALARAEERIDRRAESIVVATSADELRVHRHVWRATRSADGAVREAEIRHASERARREAARVAVAALADDPALRRSAIVPLDAVASRVTVDGRPLVAPGRQRGEVLEVDVVVPVLPLVQSSGIDAAIAPLGRSRRYVAAAVALGTLASESGIEDATVVAFGSDLTCVCVVRDGAPFGARSFSIGSASFEARRAAPSRDAEVWARCVALAASDAAGDGAPPGRTLLASDATRVEALCTALEGALARRQPAGGGSASPLTSALLHAIETELAIDPTDLIAVAAGAV